MFYFLTMLYSLKLNLNLTIVTRSMLVILHLILILDGLKNGNKNTCLSAIFDRQ